MHTFSRMNRHLVTFYAVHVLLYIINNINYQQNLTKTTRFSNTRVNVNTQNRKRVATALQVSKNRKVTCTLSIGTTYACLHKEKEESIMNSIIITTRMWANAQRDGRPVALLIATKFGWRPLECRAVTSHLWSHHIHITLRRQMQASTASVSEK